MLSAASGFSQPKAVSPNNTTCSSTITPRTIASLVILRLRMGPNFTSPIRGSVMNRLPSWKSRLAADIISTDSTMLVGL